MKASRILRFLATACGVLAGVLAANPWQGSTIVAGSCGGLFLLLAIGLFFRAQQLEDQNER
ncbi:hypothetical protein [Salinisphaera hydrothermalis]|uniref:Uncharacterized protein n=1 Tax=Salinisphaera hydrothermalis (strain C41B8) TaxID=1304275 RepID=A0A084IIN8_SALHC|nr:hypothetical protein [Salinisphaera hydrothermalis]KEZ76572.1 hypothetical protein C41B8_14190 [Salinisphaera hydrothermalis C41B8]